MTGLLGSPVTFSATANPGPAKNLLLSSGDGQSGTVGSPLSSPLVVEVTDQFGNPVSGATVNWAAATGGGMVSAPTSNTGANGLAQINATLGTLAGTDTFTATVASLTGSPVTFTATANHDVASKIAVSAGSPQSATVNTAFSTNLAAVVTDQYGNPIPGATVVFAAPGSGASGTFSGSNSALTNGIGVATAPTFTANTKAGVYTVNASTAGVTNPANFSLTNNPQAISETLSFVSGSPQTGSVGTALANPLVVQILDQYGNPFPGVTVHWAATAGGGNVSAPTSNTGANGQAQITATLGTHVGTDTYAATVAGVTGSPVSFTAIANHGPAAIVAVTAGSGQSTTITTPFATNLAATVTDRFGNPISGATVVFAAPGSGPSGTFSGSTSVVTGNNGLATAPKLTANTQAGSFLATASSAGVTNSARFSLTNLPPQQTVGIFDPTTATFHLSNTLNNPGGADIAFQFGGGGWYPVAGDWNGDGLTTIGVVNLATETWYLRNSNGGGPADYVFQFGAPGWIPVVGDWSGTGHTGIGVFNPATGNWYLRNEVSGGAPDAGVFQYGGVNWVPLAGNFFGTGHATVGIFDPVHAIFHISNVVGNPGANDYAFQFGGAGWKPFAGVFAGNSTATIGLFDPEPCGLLCQQRSRQSGRQRHYLPVWRGHLETHRG